MKRSFALLALFFVFPGGALADEAKARAAYAAKQWHRCADLFTEVASHLQGDQAASSFYDAACCFALDGDREKAFAALGRAQAAGYRNVEQLAEDGDLVPLRDDARWAPLMARVRANFVAWERSLGDAKLRRELLAFAKESDAARNAAIESGFKPAAMARVRAVDSKSTARLKDAVARVGWPGYRLVGKDGANAAWLIAQHADRDPAFQKVCLAKMEEAVKRGEADARDWAYLVDRVSTSERGKQVYGTQFDEHQEPLPIEDPAHVEDRRKAVGLGTMAEYRKELRETYGAPR